MALKRHRQAEAAPGWVVLRRAVVALVVILGVGGGLAAVLWQRAADRAGPPDRAELVAGLDVPPGGVASLGTMEISNPRRETMTVESVSLIASNGVQLFDVAVITPNDRAEHGFYDAGPGFPPGGDEWPYPVLRRAGERIPPEEFSRGPDEAPLTLKVMVAVQATQTGIVGFNGVEITYTIGNATRTASFAHALLMCTPPVTCEDRHDTHEVLEELGLLQPRE